MIFPLRRHLSLLALALLSLSPLLGAVHGPNVNRSTIDKITPDGTVSVFASGGGLSFPVGLAADSGGDLFAANFGGYSISRIGATGAVTFFANADGGPAAMAFAPTLPPGVVVPEPSSALLAIVGGIGCTVIFRPHRR